MSDDDIERVLKAAGLRERVPLEIESAAREHLRREWRAIVAERQGARRRVGGFALAASVLVAAFALWFVALRPDAAAGPVANDGGRTDDVRAAAAAAGLGPATAGRTLKAGESLETGPDGRAGISIPGIASARLDHDTRIRLRRPNGS